MFFKNARIFCSDFQFRNGGFEVVDGRFGKVLTDEIPADAIDLEGATVIPGLIEVWWKSTAMATPALTSPTAITKA